MNIKRFGLIFGTYLVLTFPIAALWHLVLFRDVYAVPALRAQPIFQLGFLSTVLQAAVVGYIYPLLDRGGPPIKEGLRFGLLMGIFLASYGALAEAAKFDVGSVGRWVSYEGAFFLVQWAVVGVAVAAVHAAGRRRGARLGQGVS